MPSKDAAKANFFEERARKARGEVRRARYLAAAARYRSADAAGSRGEASAAIQDRTTGYDLPKGSQQSRPQVVIRWQQRSS